MKCDSCVKKKDCVGYGKTPCCGAYVSEKKLTNADRIRSMTDEELAKFLSYHGCDSTCCHDDVPCDDCTGNTLKWLQKEVE